MNLELTQDEAEALEGVLLHYSLEETDPARLDTINAFLLKLGWFEGVPQ